MAEFLLNILRIVRLGKQHALDKRKNILRSDLTFDFNTKSRLSMIKVGSMMPLLLSMD